MQLPRFPLWGEATSTRASLAPQETGAQCPNGRLGPSSTLSLSSSSNSNSNEPGKSSRPRRHFMSVMTTLKVLPSSSRVSFSVPRAPANLPVPPMTA